MSVTHVHQKVVLKAVMIIGLYIACGIAFGDDHPFELKAKMATFGCDDQVSFLDIYYELYPGQWTYKEKASNRKTAVVMLDLRVFENGSEIYSNKWGMQEILEMGQAAPTNLVKMDLMRLKVPPGQYEVRLLVIDLGDRTKSSQVQIPIQIPEIDKQVIQSSDIMLCQEVRKKKDGDLELFIRDSLFVLPRVHQEYTADDPALTFYYEIENINTMLSKRLYSIKYYILNEDQVMIQEIPMYIVKRRGRKESVAQFGTISLSPVPTGNYWLNAVVEDSSGSPLVHRKIQFHMSNPDLREVVEESHFSGVPIVDLHLGMPVDEELEYIQYIINPEEAVILKQIHDDYGKKKFLEGFWKRRDEKSETEYNEYRDEYLKRVSEANVNFGKTGYGWKTDMGRVYVLYGGPSDIQRRIANSTDRPYQIWQYDEIQGGVEFVFIDLTGVGTFQLVHSTLRGEVQDYDWEKLLEVSNTSPQSIRQTEILD